MLTALTTRRLYSAVFLIALFVLAARNATDPDLGWHLRTGEDIVTTATVPQTDSFSFTAAGQERTVHEWLVDVLLYLLYSIGGFGALILCSALVAASALYLLYLRCEGKPYLASFVVLLAALAIAPFWGARPQTATLLLASIFLYLLDGFRQGKRHRSLFLLVPLTLIWANSHGAYLLGLALILTYLIGMALEHWILRDAGGWSKERQLVLVLILSTAAAAINPVGIRLYLYPLQTLNSNIIQTLIQEWQPPDFSSLAILPYAVMLVLTLGALALSSRRVGLVETLLLAGFTLASLRSARQVSLWALVAAPILCGALADLASQFTRLRPQTAHVTNKTYPAPLLLNGLILLLVALATVVRVGTVIEDQPRAETQYYPVAAVENIKAQGLRGPILNQYEWGGYLIWQLYPQEPVFIDGRTDLYVMNGDRVVKDYLEAWSAGSGWRSTLNEYGIRLVLISPSAPLSAKLAEEKDWSIAYQDERAAVFVREK